MVETKVVLLTIVLRSKTMPQKAKTTFLIVLLLSLGCGSRKEKAEAEAMAVQIHNQLKTGDYKAIYKSSRQQTQKMANESEFVTMMESLHENLGAFKNAGQNTYVVRYDINQGKMCVLIYEVEFERKRATERIEFTHSDQGKLEFSGLIYNPIN